MDCSPFLEWDEEELESTEEQAVVFLSLIATLKIQRALDDDLEAKAVKFIESVNLNDEESADAFLESLVPFSGDSQRDFIQCIVVLLSSACHVITNAAMKMFEAQIRNCSIKVLLALVQADLIPQLIITLNPQSLSFAEAVDIHVSLLKIIDYSLWLSTPDGLEELGIEDRNEEQDVPKTVLTQVVTPSEHYIWHLCVNRFSIIDGDQSKFFLRLLVRLIQICPYHQPTMEFVLHMPIVLTIPNCFAFFEDNKTIWCFLFHMIDAQRECNETRGELHQMWKTVHRMLRMEGIEDAMEEKLRNDKNGRRGGWIVADSIRWNNLLGMNLPEQK
ncbi:hypothetical protein BLNAU_11738 [Blattamonas nauphoetae]|uniref:Uncharacterized protein n=1 Tax=Blattamonas nauphoetae TaxID=2049346 RepID=A0ABQ9XS83_9EUKA|nr:hypothetical protein BLNAU_11738 [Blattamonas nauphoetae]